MTAYRSTLAYRSGTAYRGGEETGSTYLATRTGYVQRLFALLPEYMRDADVVLGHPMLRWLDAIADRLGKVELDMDALRGLDARYVPAPWLPVMAWFVGRSIDPDLPVSLDVPSPINLSQRYLAGLGLDNRCTVGAIEVAYEIANGHTATVTPWFTGNPWTCDLADDVPITPSGETVETWNEVVIVAPTWDEAERWTWDELTTIDRAYVERAESVENERPIGVRFSVRPPR